MRVAVIVYPGTNCDLDTKYAFEMLGCEVDLVWHSEGSFEKEYDLVVLPGGFSYGDYLRSGSIAKFSKISEAIMRYAKSGGRMLGICNGFQILLELGLLPGAMKKNKNIHFISKYQHLRVENSDNDFLKEFKDGEIVNIPIAHGEGNYFIDEDGLKKLEDNHQILVRYCDKEGNLEDVNGSVANIAGICNKDKNIFGLMPHTERAMEEMLGGSDGVRMLKGFLANS